jgi:hypothetical protein
MDSTIDEPEQIEDNSFDQTLQFMDVAGFIDEESYCIREEKKCNEPIRIDHELEN